jgi:hypothetical protein
MAAQCVSRRALPISKPALMRAMLLDTSPTNFKAGAQRRSVAHIFFLPPNNVFFSK